MTAYATTAALSQAASPLQSQIPAQLPHQLPVQHGGPAASMAAAATAGTTGASTPGLAPAPRKLSGRRRRETVAVLIFGGAPIFESSIPLSVFGVDRQDAGVPRYRLLVCAGEDGPLATTGGLTLTAPYGLEALSRAGTIVVPAWRSISQPPPVEAIAALRKAHHEGARIIGLCTGAFVLAAAGLLDGRPATTHWMYAPTLAKRYPRVHVDPRELFVDDGDVLTSAGTAAGIDLCLHVVRSDHGAEAANALARRLVVPSRRGGGGQAQYIDQSLPEEIGNDPLAEVVTWALENLNQQFDVEVLAARAYMSRRTFDRRFRTLTGSAPLQWLITQRVLQAQRLLETSELSVDDVARRCGFRSPVALRGHFRRQLGVSPAAYRTSYRARRPAPTPAVPSQGHPADRAPGSGTHVGQTGQVGSAGAATPQTPGSPGNPPPAKNRIRPLVPAQPGPASRPPRASERASDRASDRSSERIAERTVEHAVAEEEGHGQPTARGLGQGHRPDGAALAGSRPDTRTDTHPDTGTETHTDPDDEGSPGAARPNAAGRQLSGSRDRAVG
ncbi:transcriptional regulator GlxA family with amidase domain [Kitasatospora atroaurantiaca]|uniref:Transcriptional regulator GlxA family with amidase domain n=1 Tax=Kitasatospora atroaurantiaca TaxID=285545 RepID=A0A561EP74_9ACTN|nr:transcriptional regulator GlxA family with amidase domain [Kitasatospora atroaurantiaca]